MKRYHVIGASIGLAVIVLVIVVINRSYKPYKTGPNVRAEFLENLENVGALTFRSFDGKWIGTDCDVDLHFVDSKHVVMVVYGYGVQTFRGTYIIDSNGVIAASFPRSVGSWPKMIIGRDAESLLLDTADGSAFYFGWRSRANDGINYWPFRPASDTEITKRHMDE